MSGFHRDLKSAEAETGTLGQKLSAALSWKNILKGGLIFGLGTTLPGLLRDLVGFAGEAASNFRELQQTGRTIDQVFGDSASTIRQWGEDAAESAGLAKREVFESAAVMGSTLRNMGLDADQSADLVVRAQQRAADLAIAFGRDVGDAILGVNALLRGEYDTIEKFGVRIKEADVKTRILALGLDTSTDAARRQAEAIATLDLFFEQTASSADRFADSQDDLAVKLEKNGAKWENFVDDFVGPTVNSLLDDTADLAENTEREVDAIGEFFDRFTPEAQEQVSQVARALGVTFNEALEEINNASMDTGRTWDETVDDMLASAYELGEEGAESFDHFTAAFTAMGDRVDDEADGIAKAIPAAVKEHWQEIHDAGVESVNAYNAGIFYAQSSFLDEIDNLLKLLDENLEPGEEIAELRGRKMELMLARGIAAEKGDLGAVAAIDDMIEKINRRLATLNGYTYGYNLVTDIAQGMKDAALAQTDDLYAVGTIIREGVGIYSEPKDPNSPLRGITKWGGNMVKTIAEGIYGELDTGTAASRALAGALVPSLGVAIPSMQTAGGLGGGQTINYTLIAQGVPYQVGSPEEMVDKLVELGAMQGDGRLA